MGVRDANYYEACDRAIQVMNRINLEAFGQLKMVDWDKVNVVQTVMKVYRKSAKQARKRYFEIGFEVYLLGLLMCGTEPKKAHRMAEKAITLEWVDDILGQTDFVTLFRFNTETERKAYRLAETLEVSDNRDMEINKALRFWSQQLGQYAINVTDYALIQAFMDYGLEMAQWESQKDGRECGECRAYDGQVFRINEIPPKPHWGCRCRFRPVFRKAEDPEVAKTETRKK